MTLLRLQFRPLSLSLCLLLAASPLSAQTIASGQAENVRLDYAQVLNVEPVYATQRARRNDKVCDDAPKQAKSDNKSGQQEEGRWARTWDSVKGWFGDDEAKAHAAKPEPAKRNCRAVPAQDEQAPIAYDVDYMYKGMKYRARLPEDPGNRLRIRISVTPYLPGGDPLP